MFLLCSRVTWPERAGITGATCHDRLRASSGYVIEKAGAQGRNRTTDTRIFRTLLPFFKAQHGAQNTRQPATFIVHTEHAYTP
jgi:hypothetical protein